MYQGVIARVIAGRGFCFVRPDDPDIEDVFAHAYVFPSGAEYDRRCVEGARVEFDIIPAGPSHPGRYRAVNARFVEPDNALERDWSNV